MMRYILTFCILISLSLASLAQSFSYTYYGVTFKGKIENGQANIKSFDSNIPKVVVPATILYHDNGYPVTKISVFMNGVNYSTESLTLEEGIIEIDKFCFTEFRKLREVKLPSTLQHIGKNAFRNNKFMSFTMLASISETGLRNGNEMWISSSDKEMQSTVAPALLAQQQEQEKQRLKDEEKARKQVEKQAEKDRKRQAKEEIIANLKLKKQVEKEQRQHEEQLTKAEKESAKEKDNNSKKKGLWGIGGKVLAALKGDADNEDQQSPALSNQNAPQNNDGVITQPTTAIVAQAPPPLAKQQPHVDVDIDIPEINTNRNLNTYCVIIANEKYEDVQQVDYAERDGVVFREYCIKTLGIPEKQIKSFVNASYTDIKRALNWVETMTDISEGNSKVLFYYAGHGIPNEKDKAAYLIPVDGFPKDITTCFKLGDIYGRLGNLNTQNITVILDACFSGIKRGSEQALLAARGVAIKPKEEPLPPNMVVFTATSDDETALSFEAKRHGMFTYFLLDQLKKSKGNISFGELFRSLSLNVKKNSMLENEKLQSPNIIYSTNLSQKWENFIF